MSSETSIFELYAESYQSRTEKTLTLQEYLEGCREDPMMYARRRAAHAGRHWRAGDWSTRRDDRAARPHLHEPHDQALSPPSADFYGLEATIERIVGFFRHAAQGLEERKQILYLLGPVGGGKVLFGREAQAA